MLRLNRHGEVASADRGELGVCFLAGASGQRLASERIRGGGIGPERADFDFLRLLGDEVVILLALFVDIGGDHARRKASGEVAFFAALSRELPRRCRDSCAESTPTNQALSLTVWEWPSLAARALLMVWALPVFPAKSIPSRCERGLPYLRVR